MKKKEESETAWRNVVGISVRMICWWFMQQTHSLTADSSHLCVLRVYKEEKRDNGLSRMWVS